MTYGTIIDNTLHPAPRAVRIGGAATALGKTREEIDAVDRIKEKLNVGADE